MEGFYEKIRDPANKGAAFFAVCRGKVFVFNYWFEINKG